MSDDVDDFAQGWGTASVEEIASQSAQGATIMGLIVPTVIHLMMENPKELWGDRCYPAVE